jgi:predicted flavoprotein YhiN
MLYARLWAHLLGVAGLRPDLRWAELGAKGMNRLVATLTHHTFRTGGKNRFKDEFVTCGGVALSNVSPSLQSTAHPGLFFAGEVLDIDAITGGFNLQAAWTTGYVAAEEMILES